MDSVQSEGWHRIRGHVHSKCGDPVNVVQQTKVQAYDDPTCRSDVESLLQGSSLWVQMSPQDIPVCQGMEQVSHNGIGRVGSSLAVAKSSPSVNALFLPKNYE